MQKFRLVDILTPREIRTCIRIWQTDRMNFHRRVEIEVINPVLPRINARTGQENLPGYLSYAIEYAMGEIDAQKRK